ncbi:hypothetical protein [Asanoa siamensis]|uniref:Peptidase inhibitor family I36 n=1 Tax=Asanoa siamensis TaxID=926357 RepID=A0ABQ4D4T4_9ACTN|nr:hypothetical protein [Asanoa siamensis]GIF78263.1 hypothetical protein Asi02nite_77810 [Asanoa siamensis]
MTAASALVFAAPAAASTAAPVGTAGSIEVDWCRGPGDWAGIPGGRQQAKARSDGKCTVIYIQGSATNPAQAAQLARAYVHESCGDAICTIQSIQRNYWVFKFYQCDVFDLSGFAGLFDTHNHGSMGVWFYGKDLGGSVGQPVITWYWAGRQDPVRWDPVYSLKTCAF